MPEPQRLYERLAQQIAEGIARGAYAIGQRLPSERDLAQRFGEPRPTVRQAMIALELDGLVDVRTGSRVYVTRSSPPAGVTGEKDIGLSKYLKRAVPSKVKLVRWPRHGAYRFTPPAQSGCPPKAP